MENYEIIKKACIDANPKILDLVFGCEVWSLTTIYTIYEIKLGRVKCITPKGHKISFPDGKDTRAKTKGQIKILGRKILIGDLLLALAEKTKLSSKQMFMSVAGGFFEEGKLMADYNTIKNLDWHRDNRKDVIKFLADLLR